ncbi:MAG: DNA polymerase III subunit gamma/tau, partial [Planctomycetales bacterium]|nr:DNA polymerase III subunit gamma/tau [Planctomycetales bacterium]
MDKESSESSPTNYTVVARRYRPREFDQLVGQAPIARALTQAIESGRVGHAYLFTGARGVGKTSTARIFAKALNTSAAATEDLAADIAQAIDAGGDMDVIEIDGASNRGIEEIRQLRANVNVRPSRSPYKIYIIDEVHMLTNQAFNALLKTLEEPPGHVKFIFCTTDPDKIPITVLSRCQRFDFAPVKFEAIQQRLVEICEAEGYTADSDALALLARRAAGSMRDSQSLLEQVMSFSSNQITVEQVHELLGTADEGRLLEIAQAMRDANALLSIQLAQDAAQAGADPGQLAEQLLNYLRDIMAIAVGGGPDLLKIANPLGLETLKQLADSWGLQTILSAIQILDESLVRMRSSVSATTLLEVALVQICQLEKMASIAGLLESLQSGPGSSPTRSTVAQQSLASEKKNLTSPRLEAHESSSPSTFQETEQHASVVPSSTPDLNPPLQNSSATQGESLPTAVL